MFERQLYNTACTIYIPDTQNNIHTHTAQSTNLYAARLNHAYLGQQMMLSHLEMFHTRSQPSLRHCSSLQRHQPRCVWWSHWSPDQLDPPGPRWAGGTGAWQCWLHWRWDWTWTVPLHLFQGTWYSTGWRLRTPPLTPPVWTIWGGAWWSGGGRGGRQGRRKQKGGIHTHHTTLSSPTHRVQTSCQWMSRCP